MQGIPPRDSTFSVVLVYEKAEVVSLPLGTLHSVLASFSNASLVCVRCSISLAASTAVS